MILTLESSAVINLANIVGLTKPNNTGARQLVALGGGRDRFPFTPKDNENLQAMVGKMNAKEAGTPNLVLQDLKFNEVEVVPFTSGDASVPSNGEPTEDVQIANLRAYCDDNGITYNKTHKIKGLQRSIELWQKRNGEDNQPSRSHDPAAVGATAT